MRLNVLLWPGLACALLAPGPTLAVEIIAHRGASYDAPENTLSAFKLGFEQRADADELDIHLTKDGKIVVMHDADTARTAGITNHIAKSAFRELRRLDVGGWGKWKGKGFSEKVPSLEEIVALPPAGKRLFIEIKCGPEVLPVLEQVLVQAGKAARQFVIIGFRYETVVEAKAKFPRLEVYWLVSGEKKTKDSKEKEYPPVEDLIQRAKAGKLDGLNLEGGFPIDHGFVRKVHDAGLKLYTWTVDDPSLARKLVAAGVDGLTTNRPRWMREQLAQTGGATATSP